MGVGGQHYGLQAQLLQPPALTHSPPLCRLPQTQLPGLSLSLLSFHLIFWFLWPSSALWLVLHASTLYQNNPTSPLQPFYLNLIILFLPHDSLQVTSLCSELILLPIHRKSCYWCPVSQPPPTNLPGDSRETKDYDSSPGDWQPDGASVFFRLFLVMPAILWT